MEFVIVALIVGASFAIGRYFGRNQGQLEGWDAGYAYGRCDYSAGVNDCAYAEKNYGKRWKAVSR